MNDVDWKIGVEIELLAPRGRSRMDLAEAIASAAGGRIRPCLHPQSEPSALPGSPIFENLTLGYEALDADGRVIARCVDDLTLQADLDRDAPPTPGWWRIAGDDARLLRLVARHADPSDPLEQVLLPAAKLFGTETTSNEQGMYRLADATGASIAIAAPLPGERERPCELVTMPMSSGQSATLTSLLSSAVALGFTKPVEGATHIHFDGVAIGSAPVVANLVQVLSTHRLALRALVGTNPRCVRLDDWPRKLVRMTRRPDFLDQPWEAACARLADTAINKYCDFNLRNLVIPTPDKHTFEVRIFPVWMEAEPILMAAGLFAGILRWSIEAEQTLRPVPSDLGLLIDALPVADDVKCYWRSRVSAISE